jgi:hypothetical protein
MDEEEITFLKRFIQWQLQYYPNEPFLNWCSDCRRISDNQRIFGETARERRPHQTYRRNQKRKIQGTRGLLEYDTFLSEILSRIRRLPIFSTKPTFSQSTPSRKRNTQGQQAIMDPEAGTNAYEQVYLSFDNNENERGIIVVESKQRRVASTVAGNNSVHRCSSITVLIPLHSPTDASQGCRLSNGTTDRDPEGQLYGVGAAVLLDFSHNPSEFKQKKNIDIVCSMLACSMQPCDSRDDGIRSAISKGIDKRRIVAYVFPPGTTCNNRLFNNGIAVNDDFSVVLHRAAATSKFSGRTDLPDQLTPFVGFEVAVDDTDEIIRINEIEYVAPEDLMAAIHKMNGKKFCFEFFYFLSSFAKHRFCFFLYSIKSNTKPSSSSWRRSL